MKKLIPIIIVGMFAAGCGPEFWGGGAAGVVGAGAGYEMRASSEMNRITEDLKAGRIDQREYDIRKDEISRFSFLK